MAIGCEEASARMMELLYGELAGDDRAAIEAHVAGCASCRAELAGFESTRAAARRALDADAPPARAHQAILRAAAAAVEARTKPQPIEARPTPAPVWARIRARWTLPTFATVGAVAVFLLAIRIFLEPDKTAERGRELLRSTPAAAPQAPTPAIAPARPEAPAAPAARAAEAKASSGPGSPKTRKTVVRSSAEPDAQKRRLAPAGGNGFGLGGLSKGDGAGATVHPAAKRKISDDMLEGLDGLSGPPARAPADRQFAPPPPPRAPSAAGSAEGKPSGGHAQPLEEAAPVAEEAVARAQPTAHATTKKELTESSDSDDSNAAPRRMAKHAPAPAAPAPATTGVASASATPTDRAAPRATKVDETPVARADRLFAEGRWSDAASAYRELLRHDPHNADAGRWRQRLAESQAAAQAAQPAPDR